MKRKQTRIIVAGGIFVAAALALSYLKIPIGAGFGGWGGSVDLVMVPLIVYAVYAGAGWGVAAGLVFGMLKYLIGEGTAINWISIIFDYAVAYAAVGLAGAFRGQKWGLPIGALVGCLARFIIHFISGITVYAMWMPEEFLNMTMTNTWLYSLLYNGTYMLPNTILAVVICAVLQKPLEKYLRAEK